MKLLRQVVDDPLVRTLRELEARVSWLERRDVPADLLERVKKLEKA